jgi:hypothetical protein
MFAYYYGQLANQTDSRAAALVVKRYYAVASRGDARRACSMIVSSVAEGLPIEYGKYGASYLRGAKTCQAVLSRMFQHNRAELALPVTVRGVLVSGGQGYAFVNSKKMPVSVVALKRRAGGWVIDSGLGSPVALDGLHASSAALGQ